MPVKKTVTPLTSYEIQLIRLEFPNIVEKDEQARKQVAAGWQQRLDTLAYGAVNPLAGVTPLSRQAFCKKHKINKFMLLRYIKGTKLASWETIDEINAALIKEKV